MGLKFRRGTNAQKSGSLAFGEPYVNTDLGTLQIGGLTGDITLGASGTGSQGSFAGISGSSLDITGNAKIDGNLILGGTITIGDAPTDNVVVNADLSSSIIPNDDNAFDLGSTSKRYRAIHGTNIYGTINATNGIVSGSTQVIGILTSLNAFSASENTKSETLRLYTASVDTKFSTLATTTASLLIETANLETFSASALTRFTRIEESTASLNTFSASQNTKSETLRLYTASVDVKFSTLQTYTASVDTTNTTQNNRLNRLEESTASLNSLTSSYARTNTANVFTANQTITGSLFITQDLVVQGSSSIQTISSSRLDIGDNIIQLNVNSPSLRFGGLAIFDSGSAGSSGSLLYDSVEDEFIFVHKGNGTNVTSSHFVLGPETYDNLGNETYLTINRLPKATGKEHIVDSNITDTGTLITLGSNTVVNGTLVASGTSLVSASAQINYTQLSGISANIISASTDSSNVDFIISGGSITANLFGGVVSGSAQVVGILSSLNTYTGSNDTTNTTQNTRLTRIEESTSSLNTLTASLATTYEGRANASKTLFSGSSQVVGSAITTNTITIGSTSTALGGTSTTLAGLTSVSSTAFTGALTGNASTATTLQTARTINGTSFNGSADITIPNLVSGSSQITAGSTTGFATDVKTQLDANTVVSGSSQINVASTTGDIALGTRTSGNYVASLVAGTNITLSNNTGEGATPTIGLTNNAITIAGTSTSLGGTITAEQIRTAIGTVVTGSAQISLGSASGNIALATQTTGDYVASLVAGTGVTLSNNSGENATPTIAIGQSVATNATPTFGNLTINGSINATGDITAYYTSDKRHKNNIQPIENALLKVSKLNGVTWEWNDDVHEVTKSTPKTGLIAQEVQEVLPEVIKEREDGFLALDYSKMMGLMVEAIKEQQSQIHNLTLEIENLKKVKGL